MHHLRLEMSWRSCKGFFVYSPKSEMKIYEVACEDLLYACELCVIRDNLLSLFLEARKAWWWSQIDLSNFSIFKSSQRNDNCNKSSLSFLQNSTHRTHPSAFPRPTTAHPRWITTRSTRRATRKRTERIRANSRTHHTNVNFAINRSHVWATWRSTSRWVCKDYYHFIAVVKSSSYSPKFDSII